MFLCLTLYLLVSIQLLFSFGEPPIMPNNLGPQANTTPASAQAAIDGLLDTSTTTNSFIIDLQKMYYISTINVFQKIPPQVKLSRDIINWEIVTLSATLPYTVVANNATGRYISITNTENISCQEVAIYPANVRATFVSINVVPQTTTAKVFVRVSLPVYTQLIYGLNYDFVYHKQLLGTWNNLSPDTSSTIILTDLVPQTTYRYQFRMHDLSGNLIESNYFTFTTLPAT